MLVSGEVLRSWIWAGWLLVCGFRIDSTVRDGDSVLAVSVSQITVREVAGSPMDKYSEIAMKRMFKLGAVSVGLLVAVIASEIAWAHSKLVSPAPRAAAAESGLEGTVEGGGLNFGAPCGPDGLNEIPPGAPTATLTIGMDVVFVFETVVNHGDELVQLFVSTDDGETFDELSAPATAQGGELAYVPGGISVPDGTGLRDLRASLVDLPAGPAILRYTDGEYFSCADVLLSSGAIFSDGFEDGGTTNWSGGGS